MMNIDTILYIIKFLSIHEKKKFLQLNKECYACGKYMFKTNVIQVTNDNIEWIKKYKPQLKINDINYVNLPNIVELHLNHLLLT